MFSEYFRKTGWKRIIIMLMGNIFLGMGVAVFKFAHLGNDAFNGMVMALSECIGIEYGHFFAIFGLALFLVQLVIGRKYIGLGTVINCFFLGYVTSFTYDVLIKLFGQPDVLWIQLLVMVIGVLVCSLGISMYQKPDVGTSPYDSLSLILAERFTKVPYFWWRMLTDGICALICFLAGGLVGIGMLVAAFGFGPFIAFFDRSVTEKLLK